MSREIIQEALNGIRDEYITEAGARLGLLAVGAAGAVGAASGAAVDPSTLYSLSGTETAVKTGFGAWLAMGGWIALAAGAVAAAGIAVGTFLLGSDGFEWPTFPQGIETKETASDETEPDTELETTAPDREDSTQKEPDTELETTAPDREDSTQKEPDTEPPASEDTTGTPDESRRLQFPLTGSDDTSSFLRLPDLQAPEGDLLEFCVYPTDTDSTDPVAAFRLLLRTDGETNVQVIHYRNEDTYGFFYMHESSYVTDLDGIETRYVEMQASTLTFVTDRSYLNSTVYYYHADGGDSVRFGYSDAQRQSILARYKNTNEVALGRVEDMLYKISKRGDYEFTVVYSYIDGVETVNTPIEEMPTFDFPVFNEYGFHHD